MAQRAEEEAGKMSGFRAFLSNRSEFALHQDRLKTRLQILDHCSRYDHETTWRQIRKLGNATALNERPNIANGKGNKLLRHCYVQVN